MASGYVEMGELEEMRDKMMGELEEMREKMQAQLDKYDVMRNEWTHFKKGVCLLEPIWDRVSRPVCTQLNSRNA